MKFEYESLTGFSCPYDINSTSVVHLVAAYTALSRVRNEPDLPPRATLSRKAGAGPTDHRRIVSPNAFRTHSGSSGSPLFGIFLVVDHRWIHENPPLPAYVSGSRYASSSSA